MAWERSWHALRLCFAPDCAVAGLGRAVAGGAKKSVASVQGPRKYQGGGADRWGSVAIRASAEIGLKNPR